MLIRRETEADVDAIDGVHARAFATPDGSRPIEVDLVRALRASPDWIPALSLLADDGDGCITGHVVCSRGRVGAIRAVGLGPIGVVPERQGRGIGQALMHAVVAAADALGEPFVAVLGDQDFYGRFGFVPASATAIVAPDSGWGDHFQIRALSAYRQETAGTFVYAGPFADF